MKIDISKIKTVEFEEGLKLCASIKSSFGDNEAYVVGGCVRDILRAAAGQTEYPEIHDVDIATNMPMDILTRRYKTASNNGEAHGTMLVFMGDIPFEVTQFRTDGTYSDGRHPDSVTFAKTFDEDVQRRDFTINAIGIDGDGTIIDPVNGVTDITNSYLRRRPGPQGSLGLHLRTARWRRTQCLRLGSARSKQEEIVLAIFAVRPPMKKQTDDRCDYSTEISSVTICVSPEERVSAASTVWGPARSLTEDPETGSSS